MIKGKTSSGFEYEIENEAFDDWEVLEELVKLDNGKYSAVIKVLNLLVGEKQAKALKEHCRNADTGRVPKNAMYKEIAEILNGAGSEGSEESTKNA